VKTVKGACGSARAPSRSDRRSPFDMKAQGKAAKVIRGHRSTRHRTLLRRVMRLGCRQAAAEPIEPVRENAVHEILTAYEVVHACVEAVQ